MIRRLLLPHAAVATAMAAGFGVQLHVFTEHALPTGGLLGWAMLVGGFFLGAGVLFAGGVLGVFIQEVGEA